MVGIAVTGAAVTRIDVGEAVIWVGSSNAGMTVFVGGEAGLVGNATVTARSHADITTIKIDRNKKIFFMFEFPFSLNHIHQNKKLPRRGRSFNLAMWTG
jgi:hypothetical protein